MEPGKVPGATIGARVATMWGYIQTAYDDYDVDSGSRLEYLDREMWYVRDGHPVLDAKFGKVKSLLGSIYIFLARS